MTKEGTVIYFARKHDCEACALKPKCRPNAPARKIARSIHEAARDKARAIAKTEGYAVSRRERKKFEMLFAHLKRILRLGDCASAVQTEPKMSSYWPPPPKICGNWRNGTVKLRERVTEGSRVLFTGSGGGCHVRDFAPYSEGSVAQGSPPIRGNGFRVGNMKKVRDLVMDGQEPLCLPG